MIINDVTLREGAQTKRSIPTSEAVRVGQLLASLGLRQIQVGWPGADAHQNEMLREARAALGPETVIETVIPIHGNDWSRSVDAALEAEVDWIALLHPTSDIRLERREQISRGQVLQRVVEAVTDCSERGGAQVRFGAVDASRSAPDFLLDVFSAAKEAGARRVSLSDTVGAYTPATIHDAVSLVRDRVGLPVQVHCHDDLGLALANTLAAWSAGATVLDVSVNGMGERTGNCALDELAVMLQHHHAVDLGVSLQELTPVSREICALLGDEIASRKPLIGRAAFSHHLGTHVGGALMEPRLFESLESTTVGNERRFLATPHLVEEVIPGHSRHGLSVAEILARLRKHLPLDRLVTVDELIETAQRHLHP